MRLGLFLVLTVLLTFAYAQQFAALSCESYCNVKRENQLLLRNEPVNGVCLYNGNPQVKYGRSCFCRDGYYGTNCLEQKPDNTSENHVNDSCMFNDDTRFPNLTNNIRLCGCNIGWGGPDCSISCEGKLPNCTAPNYCYYAKGEFQCGCAKDRIGENCSYDMRTLFQAHDLTAGYSFMVIFTLLLFLAILIFYTTLRLKGCELKLFCAALLVLSTGVKLGMTVFNLVGVHWQYAGTRFTPYPLVFDFAPLYVSSFGSVLQLCCNVSMIFLWKHIVDQVENLNFKKRVSHIDKVILSAIMVLLIGAWVIVVLLSYFNVIRFNAILFLMALEILPIALGFTIYGIQMCVVLRRNEDDKVLKAYKFMRFMICNNIVLCMLFLLMVGGGISLYILPEFIYAMNETVMSTLTRSVTTVIYALEVLTFLLMAYLLFDIKAWKLYIFCCCSSCFKKKEQHAYSPVNSEDTDLNTLDNKLGEDDEDIKHMTRTSPTFRKFS